MTTKIPIAEGTLKGNLNELTQVYRVNYLPKEGEYSPKIELAILMFNEKEDIKGAYRSIRFTNNAQIFTFCLAMVKAYFIFGKETKEINNKNFQGRLQKFLNMLVMGIKNG